MLGSKEAGVTEVISLDISSSNSKTIISNGIINAYSESQAKKRSKADSKKNKGFEAASAMVRMIECLV